MNIDLYELSYRNIRYNEYRNPDININISENKNVNVLDVYKHLEQVDSKDMDEISFSDVTCTEMPIVDEETHHLSYRYEYVFVNECKNGNPNEYKERFKKFDINTLPLIEVAKYLNIKVEKSNMIKPYGIFSPANNKITLGTDYAPTFIHELAHAIDHILPITNCLIIFFFVK
jgi:hypothetical protein